MAINVPQVQTDVKDALTKALAAAYGDPKETYDEFAGILSDSIVPAILNEIKVNADVTVEKVSIGTDTATGGVD